MVTNYLLPATNIRLAQWRVRWLNEALYFVSSSVLTDSFRLRNRQLLEAANRYLIKFTCPEITTLSSFSGTLMLIL